MNVELICVGSELLSGDVVNTNAAYISKKLQELGHDSFRQFTVDDNKYRLSEILEHSLKRCDILIITGGLGPTADDITKETVCEFLGIPLVENEHCRKHLDLYFARAGKIPTENNFKQATAPKDAIIFNNDIGTACGICIEDASKRIILLPGPPKELVRMFDTYVMPYLKKLNHNAIVSHSLNVFGLGESAIETIIKPLCNQENPVVATYCGNNECEVKVTATAKTEDKAEMLCSETLLRLRELLGDYVYGSDSDGLAAEVVNSLRSKSLKISTAESCTGGMLSQSLTSVPHASEVVEIGILAYSNRIKQEALSVPEEILEEYGAISAETAMYLAKNVRILSGSDIGVSITGNAGPSANENKPVGLVYVCVADKTKYFVKRLTLSPDFEREKIRSYATLTALDLVRKYVSSPFGIEGMIGYDMPFTFAEDIITEAEKIKSNSDDFSSDVATEFDPNINFVVFEPDDASEDSTQISMFELEPEEECAFDESHNEEVEKKKRKANVLTPFVNFFTKNNSIVDVIIKVVSVVAAIGLITSSSVLIYHFAESNKQMNIIEEARDEFDFANVEKNAEDNRYVSFNELYAQNSDIRAWIEIPGNAKINNPVYQAEDNDYYLTHNMLKKKSRYGALFFDQKNLISTEGNSQNLTIYGHNMKDKSMFASLIDYKNLKYYKQHSIVNLKTLYDQSEYIIFSVMVTAGSSADDNGSLYKFYRSDFDSDADFMSWIAEAKERSLITTDITIEPGDEILTLATCGYDFENARFVVMAKKLKDGEPRPNVSGAIYNPNVRYPQAWYDKNGLEGYNPDANTSSDDSSTSSEDTGSDTSSDEVSSDITSSDITSSVAPPASNCKHEMGAEPPSTDAMTHRYICAKCDGVVTESHNFSLQQSLDKYKKNGTPNCTTAATYYYSCVCGAHDTTKTFTVGTPTEHTYGADNLCTVCKAAKPQDPPPSVPDTDPEDPTENQPTT